jgi:ATP/ADP translocase
MKYYSLLMAAVVLGQLFVASLMIYYYQSKNENINYLKASGIYFNKSIARYVMIISFTLLVMFVLSDYMDLNITRAELMIKGELSKFEKAQKNFRTIASVYGMFAELVPLLVYKGVGKAIMQYSAKLGIDSDKDSNG